MRSEAVDNRGANRLRLVILLFVAATGLAAVVSVFIANRDRAPASLAWVDSEDRAVPSTILAEFPGGRGDCGLSTSVVFLYFSDPRVVSREGSKVSTWIYMKDPHNESGIARSGPRQSYEDNLKRLPPRATFTGYRSGNRKLWVHKETVNQYVYIVQPGRIERWQRVGGECA